MANVVVWSKEGCHYCKDVKDFLIEQKIVFQDIDVTDHDYLREVLQAKYGICHVPVVEIGNIENGPTKLLQKSDWNIWKKHCLKRRK